MEEGISGGCACGAVRYQAAPPVLMMNCHCRDCQRATGSAYSPNVVVPRSSVQMRGNLRFFEKVGGSGQVVGRGFCPECGSPIAGEIAALPDVTVFYAASLDDPSMHKPTMDIHTASAAPWDEMSPHTEKSTGGIGAPR